ncbi:MAG: Dabb family protein [Nocardioidaceae bacterium]
MYHSIATFTFREGTTASQVEALAAALKTFASGLEGVRSYSCGADMRLREGTDDFAVAATFDNEVALRTYLAHPEHAEISRLHVEPILAGKHNAQFIT